MKTTPNRLCHSLAPFQLKGSIKSLDNQYFVTVATISQTQAIYYAYTLHLNVTIPCPVSSVQSILKLLSSSFANKSSNESAFENSHNIVAA